MRIQLLSDLHLETHPHFRARPAPGADLLVLAGDIGSYQNGSALDPGLDPDFGLDRFAPERGWPVPVLYVPGNHEYDGLDFDETHARLRASCDRLGITWLERASTVIDGVRFIGTTLWSDFDALGAEGESPTRWIERRERAFRAANFHLRRTGTTRGGQAFLAEQVREEALRCQAWLDTELAHPHAGPTVVITHFAPSLGSVDPRYGLTPGTAAFCNALDDRLERADLWLHGHLHCAFDYRLRGCRVVANPMGYAAKGEQAAFREDFLIELTARARNTRS